MSAPQEWSTATASASATMGTGLSAQDAPGAIPRTTTTVRAAREALTTFRTVIPGMVNLLSKTGQSTTATPYSSGTELAAAPSTIRSAASLAIPGTAKPVSELIWTAVPPGRTGTEKVSFLS